MALKITNFYSPNFDIKKRDKNSIKFIVLHYTGMKKESDAIERLTDFNSKVSCHYFIKQNGKLLQMVPDLFVAWHAGKSKWKKTKSLNKNSIGIEIHNPGHEFNYNSFNKYQINCLVKLLLNLKKKYKININNILGHSDISPDRKRDPGEKFPWEVLAKKKLCLWPSLNLNKIKKFRKLKINNEIDKKFWENLAKIGYPKIIKKKQSLKYKKMITTAFQRRFRNQIVDGKIDMECYLISNNLINL